ncbi:MAG: SH3 domain-containing protein, partial [Lachnospiraceae bacterium]|nr:SH3 domain-containing protein [Lachnospiraceae bacterium]
MKKRHYFFYIIVVIFVMMLGIRTEAEAKTKFTIMYVKSDVEVRKEPNLKAKKTGKIYALDSVKTLGTEDGWTKIQYKGKTGYVKRKYLTKKKTSCKMVLQSLYEVRMKKKLLLLLALVLCLTPAFGLVACGDDVGLSYNVKYICDDDYIRSDDGYKQSYIIFEDNGHGRYHHYSDILNDLFEDDFISEYTIK